jgi:hypothetical protein
MMKSLWKTVFTLFPVLLVACWNENPFVIPEGSPEEAIVRANAQLVQEAAETFFLQTAFYPTNVDADTTDDGETLIDFLPGGVRLENPYTSELTEPVNGAVATEPGEIAYSPECQSCGWNMGFTVTGQGDSDIVITLTDDYPAKEAIVEANCSLVRDAVEAFAAANVGAYPDNVSTDETPAGDTVVDFLPGGTRLENPFTLAATEPTDGSAAIPGEIGYMVNRDALGANSGYLITGRGKYETIVTFMKE